MNVPEFYQKFPKFNQACIDSRKIQRNDIFFAFSGENFNAAQSAKQAMEDGALASIVEDENFADPQRNIFLVSSTLQFLQDLASYHRNTLEIPVIALTGSNGKTTSKELIHAVLSKKYDVQYTFGNLNNHIGVPITLLSVKKNHQIAVIEMGANHQKEIEMLCTLARPNYGYITNFGKAHLEGFGGVEGVIKGKSELFDFLKTHDGTLLINKDDEIQVKKADGYRKTITFGKTDSDYTFNQLLEDNYVGIDIDGQKSLSQLTGAYNFSNLCAAAAFGLHFGVDAVQICEAISEYQPSNMRSQIIKKNGRTLVLDTYNANPSSMAASLENFKGFSGTKTVILGDMLELGDESKIEHERILHLAKNLGFEEIICVGPKFAEVSDAKNCLNTDELIEYLKNFPIQNQNILIKGSRGISLEKIMDFIS